jgi:hypothetical protein
MEELNEDEKGMVKDLLEITDALAGHSLKIIEHANEIEKISEFLQKSIYLTVKNREKE